MTIYPVDFHRRSEQKWARRASRASEALRHLRLLPAHGLSAPDECQHPAWPLPDERNMSTGADRVSAKRRTAQIHAAAPRRGNEHL
jgi:hypothetical protein